MRRHFADGNLRYIFDVIYCFNSDFHIGKRDNKLPESITLRNRLLNVLKYTEPFF